MVAKIKSGKSLIGALSYNERKVSRGMATLIGAVRYTKDVDKLNFHDKLFRLTDLAARNERTKTNTIHISLNFANGENLPDKKLQAITADYMKGIGFENQPYLIYRHEDAGHPHIHIVSTNIKTDGNRISLHYLGQNESEKTRKAIEVQYGLVKAEEQQTQKPDLKATIRAADYGKAETKRSITNILSYVIRSYKYTTIGELNAVLQRYNIQADRGAKGSRMFSRDGLLYWITEKEGNKTGVPLKASTIYGKPTLKNLEAKFRLNEQLRKPHKVELIKTLDAIMAMPHTQRSFQKALWEKDVQVVLRQNDEGRIYGVTFIDQKNKAVFNGSDLGKAYSANQLAATFLPEPKASPKKQQNNFEPQQGSHYGNDDLLDALFAPEQQDMAALNKFKKKKRKGQRL